MTSLSLSLSHCWCEHFLGSDSFSEPTQHAQWRFVSTWAHFLICHQFFSPKSFETGQQVNSATSPSRVLPMVHGCLLFVKWLPSFTGFPHQGSNRKREHWYEKWNKNRFDRCAAVGARTCRFKTAALLPSFFFFLPGFFLDLEVRNTGRVKRGPGVNGSLFYFSLVFFPTQRKCDCLCVSHEPFRKRNDSLPTICGPFFLGDTFANRGLPSFTEFERVLPSKNGFLPSFTEF